MTALTMIRAAIEVERQSYELVAGRPFQQIMGSANLAGEDDPAVHQAYGRLISLLSLAQFEGAGDE